MAKNYYIADTHFRHERLAEGECAFYEARGIPCPFASCAERDALLLSRWNARVKRRDTVYILGDVTLSAPIEACADILSELNGQKVLILGNHDRTNLKGLPYLARSGVVRVEPYLELSDGGHSLVLTHYPVLFWNGQHRGHVLLYGHVHSSREWMLYRQALADARREEPDLAMAYNVGAMVQDYRPRTIEEILAVGEEGCPVSGGGQKI